MMIHGRDKPLAQIDITDGVVTIGVYFALRLDGWVQITLTQQELEDMLAGKEPAIMGVSQ
jgi:hypothetical protein